MGSKKIARIEKVDTSKIHIIEWFDHCDLTGNSWHALDAVAALKPALIRSVGFLIREDKDCVVIASHVDHEDEDDDSTYNVLGEMCIMKCAIKQRYTILNPAFEKRRK